MEMQQVRYFLALSDTLNFTRAAEQCNVTQPALTRAIQQLEAELGGPLFHRERRRTHLSELGRMMLPYLAQIQAQSEAARNHARSLKTLDEAPLHIGAMCTIGPTMLTDLILRFRASNPGVQLVVKDLGAKSLIEALSDGELHVGLVGLPEPLDMRFHSLPLFDERFVVAIAPNHPLASRNTIAGPDLHREPYVNRHMCEVFDHIRDNYLGRGIKMRQVFSSDRDDWVQAMIKAEMGLGLFPEFCVTNPGLTTRPLTDPPFSRTIMLVTVRGRPHSPALGAFVSQARSYDWRRAQAR